MCPSWGADLPNHPSPGIVFHRFLSPVVRHQVVAVGQPVCVSHECHVIGLAALGQDVDGTCYPSFGGDLQKAPFLAFPDKRVAVGQALAGASNSGSRPIVFAILLW